MAAAQHKLSRREVLAGACAGAALPVARHCEERSDAAIQGGAPDLTGTGLLPPDQVRGRNDEKPVLSHVEGWQRALAGYARAEAGLEAVAHSEEDDLYDRALGRHNAALARLLRTAAPDLAAAARKLDLIMRHAVFELTFGEASLTALQQDIGRLASVR